MMDWDRLRVFHAVAEAGSLTHAGDALHLSQSAISRQIRGLEDSMGAPLFHRHARGLILTEQGEHLYIATSTMSQQLTKANARIRDMATSAHGDLRVTTTVGFGIVWLTPRLAGLFATHPTLNLDLNLSEAILDLSMREADVAIRLKEPVDPDVIRRPLMEARMRLYATPEYLEQHSKLQSIEDLTTHRLITYSPTAPQPGVDVDWLYSLLHEPKPQIITVNNYLGVLKMAQSGVGIAAVPDYMARQVGGLILVLSELSSRPYTIFFAYPEELKRSRRVIAFRDYVLEQVKKFLAD